MTIILFVLFLAQLVLILWLVFRLSRQQAQPLEPTPSVREAELVRALELREEQLSKAQAETLELRAQLSEAEREAAILRTRLELSEEQVSELRKQSREINQELQAQFREMASSIMAERSEALAKRSEETMKPLRDDLKRFGEQVQQVYEGEARERFSLKNEIERLLERSMQISQETTNLTRALKGDSKVQGDWGEMILENILEQSGLRRDEEYSVQETLRDEQGNVILSEEGKSLRPDIIVRYPNGGYIIIDSKVSLTAYTAYVSAEQQDEREQYAREHLMSIRRHIDSLASKAYAKNKQGAADFVMLFVPNEPAYNLALKQEPKLWEEAYKKGIVLINGTNLIAALKMAQDLWQRDRQIKNVEKIVVKAGALYDKFVNYSESLLKAEAALTSATESLARAKGQLFTGPGNVVRRLEELKELGVSSKKSIPRALSDSSEAED
ncbi:DNA recombination protein RmuC [Porphyromonas sp. COT-239 OH1446]|uniref:DNA recombination protein RmuC n=1 Tax=Porphyromonas sp. COT-239 OH1446 TaxID=1515613 RepID=UPI00068E6502|nr:DNA recombination protein RmuC [Porphyromonas sp. COT-239 OH1446]